MTQTVLYLGFWLGLLQLPDSPLPVHFEIRHREEKVVMIIRNGEERIVCDEISSRGDSIFITLPLYDSEFRLKQVNDSLSGVWINRGRTTPSVIPFHAGPAPTDGESRNEKIPDLPDLTGKWETWFDAGGPDSSLGIGRFKRDGAKVTGTFLTESGDHRFLEGTLTPDSLKLGVFDGSHAWLYLARINGEQMTGVHYSGVHYKAPFRSRKNPEIQLRDATSLTAVTGNIRFSLPDADSVLLSSEDARYRNKVRIIQLMGSWCPNCMDESMFLDSIYRKRQSEGLEVIALAFERTPDFHQAALYLKKVKSRLDLSYPLLYAGVAKKGEVEKLFPEIKGFFSYPTTLIVDRNNRVVKVHAGFSGPATGEEWTVYRDNFNRILNNLLR